MSLKSNVMWFNARSRRSIEAPPVLLDAWLPSNKGCYSEVLAMGILLLWWPSHISTLCKKMAYYLYLIGCYQRNLPVAILKLLVLSHLRYVVSVWGPS